MSKRTYEIKSVVVLKKDLKALKKRIETKTRAEILRPYVPLILAAKKMGKTDQLIEVCRLIIYGGNQTTMKND